MEEGFGLGNVSPTPPQHAHRLSGDTLSRTQGQSQGLEAFPSSQPPASQSQWVGQDPALSEGNICPPALRRCCELVTVGNGSLKLAGAPKS